MTATLIILAVVIAAVVVARWLRPRGGYDDRMNDIQDSKHRYRYPKK